MAVAQVIESPGFRTPLDVRYVGGERPYEVIAPLKFYSASFRGLFVVKVGYRTDFASIPRWLWPVMPRDGAWARAAVVHDAAYDGELETDHGEPVRAVKFVADHLFLEAMKADGVSDFTAGLMHAAVVRYGQKRQIP